MPTCEFLSLFLQFVATLTEIYFLEFLGRIQTSP